MFRTKEYLLYNLRDHLDTFVLNPQYILTVQSVKDEDDGDFASVIVSLMQKNYRTNKANGLELLSIGLQIK